MTLASLCKIIECLNRVQALYLVVGGVAVNAHGYRRYTGDVDLMIQLERKNILDSLNALKVLGYRPYIPVTIEQFADPENRSRWISEKQMQVLKLISDDHQETVIDIFAYDPLGFDQAYERRIMYPIGEGVDVPVCGYEDLVKLKQLASRPQDIADLDQLRIARGES